MLTKWVERQIKYDGGQLRSLFAYETFGVLGDSIVAFRGPCSVTLEHMIDGEDKFAGEKICGDDMLHFIVERFQTGIFAAVSLQRLLATLALSTLHALAPAAKLRRDGDDIFVALNSGEGKLSISVATVSPVSALIHFAVNITNLGTPVKTASLADLDISPAAFASQLMMKFSDEIKSIDIATRKVFPAR